MTFPHLITEHFASRWRKAMAHSNVYFRGWGSRVLARATIALRECLRTRARDG
ncbi:hypothetical protein IMCC12053_458 [Celeribacter marinus]|uniref:Uncharacterized protein n=1 Tax=Celeribacter marinus TaxID=1397108 RepID=A0A0P0A7T4_9RHOB|nr:hypothetical protein IMCC12053_458 [Celeribacter marinus]